MSGILSSDSWEENVNSWVEVRDDLEGNEGGHLDPDGGSDRVAAHFFDVSVVVEEVLSGFSVDSLLASHSVEVGLVGSQHPNWQVRRPANVNLDLIAVDTELDQLDFGKDTEDAEAVVAGHQRGMVHLEHRIKVKNGTLLGVSSRKWP